MYSRSTPGDIMRNSTKSLDRRSFVASLIYKTKFGQELERARLEEERRAEQREAELVAERKRNRRKDLAAMVVAAVVCLLIFGFVMQPLWLFLVEPGHDILDLMIASALRLYGFVFAWFALVIWNNR
jgi:uncharacterized membrane protein